MTDDADTYAAVLRELTLLYPALPQLVLEPTHTRVTHIAHGWYMRAHRGCEAVLLLRDEGFAAESWPIRRSVLEHVVALKWLAVEGSRVAYPIKRGHAWDAAKRREGVVDAGWTSADLAAFDVAIGDGAGSEDSELDTFLNFKHRCDQYGTRDDWASYLIETAHSHPGWESAAPYLDEGPPTVLRSEPGPVDRDDTGWCAMHLWEALATMSNMMATPAWEPELADCRSRIMTIEAAIRVERGLPPRARTS